ncbi:hypothetical protein [Modestobacter versicolor]|uniref:DUF4267 domain-containing protein n=1 Tax=Modestobacter versicolor TaxID=429133 RepID=A0A323V558_9ACTN|nr:hypothetical protein [Modestobacter versicolor]MBB3677533.1 hypothetical protein [Modestobacter versicolor]PZA19631.1 hypothetical protein DMO24_19700 [Modestobacter versicolor]
MPSLTAAVGAATAAYSAALVVSPRILIRPVGLDDSPGTRALVRSLGARDAALGLAMVAAPAGLLRRSAVAARVLADCTDAASFRVGLAGRPSRVPVAVGAAAWGALSLLAGVLDERAGR